MKILIFEYITGGGYNQQPLSSTLVREGRLMLRALLDDLLRLENIELTVMLDWRLTDLVNEAVINTVIINPEQNSLEEFERLVKLADVIWPIAPEFDGILHTLCLIVSTLDKRLLSSSAQTVAITGNKFKTYELLKRQHIVTVPTQLLIANDAVFENGDWIIKPIDGAGCVDSYVIKQQQDLERLAIPLHNYIIQPHLKGAKTSLSCLFKHGRGWLICANLQHFELINQQYHLTKIEVNHHPDSGLYQEIIEHIALVLPALWGYAGIDLIESTEQTWVLEINPRLTTSFVGIYAALSINIAEAVLQLLEGEPTIQPTTNKTITLYPHAN